MPDLIVTDKQKVLLYEKSKETIVLQQQKPFAMADSDAPNIVSFVAGETIQGHRVVYLANDNKLYKADCFAPDTGYSVVGITLNAVVSGEWANVLCRGLLENNVFVFDSPNYLFLQQNGELQTILPDHETLPFYILNFGWVQKVGAIWVNCLPPIFVNT